MLSLAGRNIYIAEQSAVGNLHCSGCGHFVQEAQNYNVISICVFLRC